MCLKKTNQSLIKTSDKKLILIRKSNFNFLRKNIRLSFSNLIYKKEKPYLFFYKNFNIKKRK